MPAKPKVPLRVGWLSENGQLPTALPRLGYQLEFIHEHGVQVTTQSNGMLSFLQWNDDLLFTVADLIALGFDLGLVQYCPCCKKLQADCDQEQNDIWERNHAEDARWNDA